MDKQDIYQAIVLQTSWNLLSKIEDEKTVISWRNSVTSVVVSEPGLGLGLKTILGGLGSRSSGLGLG